MYRTVLLDSDVDNIQNFRRYIANSYPDFRVVKSMTAPNGDFIGDIVKVSPQFIIADVRFFGVNGAFSFAELTRRLPNVKFLLYGGLNDMDYLKRSVSDSLSGYMIKPVKPLDLGRALSDAKELLEIILKKDEQLKKLGESFKGSQNEFRNLFFSSLVNGVISTEDEIRENFHFFAMKMDGPFTAARIKIDHFKRINLTMLPEEKHFLIYNIFNVAGAALAETDHFCYIDGFSSVTVVISCVSDIVDIYNLFDTIKNEISQKHKTGVTIGVGRTYESPMDIPVSVSEAESAISHRFYMGYNTIIPIEFVEAENFITFRYPKLKENKLIFAAVTGEFDYCKNLLNELFDVLRKADHLPDKLISKIVICILLSIDRYLKEQNRFSDISVGSFFSTAEAMAVSTVDEGYSYLYSNMQRFCSHITRLRAEADIKILNEAKEYARKKYYESISLQKAAIIVKTTPDYLNKLFLASEQDSYFEFVTKVRLEIAKRYLIETDMDENAIAINVGYDDGRYFKALFKQYEKVEPMEYRARRGVV
ncbi:MAG: helix-turn-helix domain-containing protein [Clostridiales bacterium]|jgi:two-component system response regulator YesN|nr:helix-turn-helix domain-containing protein [Clostridiales bacterium]